MQVRERILTIRLLEKLLQHPTYAEALKIEADMGQILETAHKEER